MRKNCKEIRQKKKKITSGKKLSLKRKQRRKVAKLLSCSVNAYMCCYTRISLLYSGAKCQLKWMRSMPNCQCIHIWLFTQFLHLFLLFTVRTNYQNLKVQNER